MITVNILIIFWRVSGFKIFLVTYEYLMDQVKDNDNIFYCHHRQGNLPPTQINRFIITRVLSIWTIHQNEVPNVRKTLNN